MKPGKLRKKNYPFLPPREGVWREIVHFIQGDLSIYKHAISVCVEIGAGYCDFINQISSTRKISYEQNPEMEEFASPDVEFRCQDAVNLSGLVEGSVDLVFASNFLEHLKEEEHDILLPRIYSSLTDRGRLVLIQPNYRLCAANYFDDETHQTIFDDHNIKSFLEKYGFAVHKIIPDFLPFSMKSRFPKWPILVRMYLNSPIRPKGAQMYVVAEKR